MISPPTAFGALTVLLTYFVLKHQTLRTSSEIQEEIESRLQPRYEIPKPLETNIFPYADWPDGDFYFEVWHIEVYEKRWGRWKKWLPRENFRRRTIVEYKFSGFRSTQEQLNNHHLAAQPYVKSIKIEPHKPSHVKIIYDSVNPPNISRFIRQFRYLIRDTTFHRLNPEVSPKHEMIKDEEGNLYARIFDANARRKPDVDNIDS